MCSGCSFFDRVMGAELAIEWILDRTEKVIRKHGVRVVA